MKKRKEHRIIFDKLFDTMHLLLLRHDAELISSVMLAISHRLLRTIHNDDEEYLKMMNYLLDNAMQVEPFEFEDESVHNDTTYH